MQRALISVSDKTGLAPLAEALHQAGVEIVSTGGTAAFIEDMGITTTPVSTITNFPEILGGRVKTLHPAVHAGLLAKMSDAGHRSQLAEHALVPFSLVVANLYPFAATVANPDVSIPEAIEQIDIGGPTMLRSAAKNHEHVLAVVDPADYAEVIDGVRGLSVWTPEVRRAFALKVFRHTAAYDATVADYLAGTLNEPEFPDQLVISYDKHIDLRYGENPHQGAAYYVRRGERPSGVAGATQLAGKELSYNNIGDAESALTLAGEFAEPVAVAIKHSNPCGVAVRGNIAEAFAAARYADPVSIFGGIVAVNDQVNLETARAMNEIFLEVVLAPSYSEEALELLKSKPALRLLCANTAADANRKVLSGVGGGLLIQDADAKQVTGDSLQVMTERAPTDAELHDLLFAWRVVKHVKSNAIVIAHDCATLGVGAGQTNRVGAANIALAQAGTLKPGSVLASDAFFPMPDTVEAAAEAGVTAIIQPGGSKRDMDSIEAANDAGIAMVFTGVRHFRH
jgi:phosphoribosylaminoimidazolecarboxamide formyltransferase/IMP cyclohydrolase